MAGLSVQFTIAKMAQYASGFAARRPNEAAKSFVSLRHILWRGLCVADVSIVGVGSMTNSINTIAVPSILDMCCGSRMFWHDKQDDRAVFSDIRAEQHTLCDGRSLVISPDVIADFRALPFASNSFPVVVFDPPHLERLGENAWMRKKYGALNRQTWRDDLRAGFSEAFRVLWPHGVLIFKWNETQIPTNQVLALTDEKPIITQRTGKNDKTHWIIFVKGTAA